MTPCARCGIEFVPRVSGTPQRYCGKSCRDRRKSKPAVLMNCAQCAAEFKPTRRGHKYCSASCSVLAGRARNPERSRIRLAEAAQRWRARHPERAKAVSKAFKGANPDKCKVWRKAWKMRNREKGRARTGSAETQAG